MVKKSTNSLETKIAVMASNVEYIKSDVDEIKKKLQGDYVTKTEFKPVRDLVYGMVSLMLLSVFGALLALVLKK